MPGTLLRSQDFYILNKYIYVIFNILNIIRIGLLQLSDLHRTTSTRVLDVYPWRRTLAPNTVSLRPH